MQKYLLPAVAIVGVILGVFMVYRGLEKPPVPPIQFPPATSPYKHSVAGAGIIEAARENVEIGTPFNEIIEQVWMIEPYITPKGSLTGDNVERMGPDVCAPCVQMPEQYAMEEVGVSRVNLATWWEQFDDPCLNQLVQKALSDDFDVRLALEAIERQRAAYRLKGAELLAEVARHYCAIRALQRQVEIEKERGVLTEQERDLRADLLNAGLESGRAVEELNEEVAFTESRVAALEGGLDVEVNGLATLLGEFPEGIKESVLASSGMLDGRGRVFETLPSELLRRRPDIRQAEYAFSRATALVGSAVAELFSYFGAQREVESTEKAFEAALQGAEHNRDLSQSGLQSTIVALHGVRRALAVEEALTEKELALMVHLIGVYKALGGGW